MKTLTRVLFTLSVIANFVLLLTAVHFKFRICEVEVEFLNDLPRFSEREKTLIQSAPPELAKQVLLSYPSFIEKVWEENDEIIFEIASMSHLRNVTVYVDSYQVHRIITMDGVGPTLVFDKNMRIKKLIPLWGKEILYIDGVPQTNKTTKSNHRTHSITDSIGLE